MRDEKKTKAQLIAELNELRGKLATGEPGLRYPAFCDDLPLGLFRCTRRGEILWANRTLAGMLGYEDPEGLTGLKLRSLFVHPRLCRDLFDRLKAGEGSEAYLAELKRSDVGTFRARLTVQPDPRAGEGAEGFDGFVCDLTGEREFEEAQERRIKESAVLAALSRELYAAETVQEVLDVAVERLAEVFPAYSSVNLVEDGGRYLTVRAHKVASRILRFSEKITGQRLANWRIPLYEDSVISETIRTGHPTVCGLNFAPGEPVVETDIRGLVEAMFEKKSPLLRFGIEIAEMIGDVAFLGIPFTDSDGEVTGSITVLSPMPFNIDEYNLLKVCADIIGKAIEQKRLSQELHDSLERYRGVFEHTVLGMYRTSPDGRVLMANPALVRMLGYNTFEELSKRDLEQGYQPGYSRADFKRAVEERGEIRGKESAWTRLDGTSLHVRENARIIRDEDGKTLYYEGTVEDITERKRAEEDRDKHLREIRALFGGVDILLWSVRERADGELYYEQVNDAFAAVEGYTPDHYNGKPIADLHPPEECENIRNSFNWAKLGKIHTSEVHFGEGVDQRFFEIRLIPLTDPDGEIRRFIGAGSDITERKQAEEALVDSERRYRFLVENTYDMFYRVNLHDESYDYLSPAVEKNLGYEVAEFIEMAKTGELAKRIHPDDLAMLKEDAEALRDNGRGAIEKPVIEYRLRHKDGDYRWVSDARKVVFDEAGKATAIIGVSRDITEHKLAEEALRESEERYRVLSEGAIVGVYIYRDMRFFYVNDEMAAITGYSKEELLALDTDVLVHEEARDFLDRRASARQSGDEIPSRYTMKIKRKDGETMVLMVGSRPITYGGQTAYLGNCFDITESVRASQALRESEERYHSFWVNAPVGICLSDSHGRLTMVSPVLCAMTGYAEEELLGMELFELIAEGDKRAVPIAKTMDTHEFEQLQSLFSGGPTELTLVKKDGGLLPVEFNIDFITQKGSLKYMITLVADITDRKLAQEALRESEERYHTLQANIPVGIFRTTPDGDLISANPALVEMLGYSTEDELKEFKVGDHYVHPEQRQEFVDSLGSKGFLTDFEAPMKRKDGSTFWASLNATLVKDESGKGLHIDGILEDITDRKDTQKALAASEETYRSLHETTLALADETDLTNVISVIAEQATGLLDCQQCLFLLLDESRQVLTPIYSTRPDYRDIIMGFEVPLGVGLSGRVAETGVGLYINADEPDEISVHVEGTDEEEDTQESLISVPMFDGKRILGVITLGRFTGVFSDEDLNRLGVFARQAEIAIKRTRNLEEMAASERTYHSLYETTLALAEETDLFRVIEVIAKSASNLLDSRKCIIFLVDEGHRVLRPIYSTREDYALEHLEMQIGEGLSGHVVETGMGMFVNPGDPDKALSRHIPGTDKEATERESLISVPMFDGMRVLGAITIGRFDSTFDAEDLAKLTVYARQAEIAVKRARSSEDLAKSEETYRTLYDTTSALSSESDSMTVIRIIADQATALVKANDCTVYRVDPERRVLKPIYSNDPLEEDQIMSFEIPLGEGLSGRVAESGKWASINLEEEDDYSVHVPDTDEKIDKKESVLSVPMFDGKRVIGVLTINKLEDNFTQDDIEMMGIFARQAEIAVLRAEGLKALAESEETYHSLYDTTLTLADETDLLKIIAVICDQATKQLDSIYSTYFTYDALDEVLIPFYSNAPGEREAILSFKVPLGLGLSGAVAQSMSGIYSNYTDSDRPVVHVEGTDKDVDAIESVISEPVIDGETLLGVITIGTEEKVYNDEDLAKLRVFARLASIAIKRAEKESALEQSEETYRTLYQTTMTLADSTDLERVLAAIADNARGLMDAHFCNILSYDPEGNVLVPIYTNAPTSRETILAFRLPLGVGLGGLVAEQRRGAYSNYSDPDRPMVHVEGTDAGEEHRESVLAEPIMDSETLLGVFLIHDLDRIFTDDDLVKVRVFSRLTSIALKRGQYIQALSESEEKYRNLVEQATDGVVIIQNAKFIFANTAMLCMSGYESGEMINKSFLDFIAEEDRLKLRGFYEKRMRGEEIPSIYEMTGLHKDGSRLPMELNIGIIQYDGAPAELVIMRDITERKRAEEALRESEERYRSIWTKSPVGICLSDRDGMLTMVNPVLRQMLDFDEEELIGGTFFDLLAPGGDDKEVVSLLGGKFDTQVYKDELSLFSGKPTEMALVKKLGERLPVEVTIDFITREGSVQYMISLITDITERKKAEEALANYSADLEREVDVKTTELSAARRYLREVIDASADLITVVDAQGRIEILNHAASTAMGYGEEELRGKSIEIFYFDRDRETFKEMTRRLSEGGPSIVRQVDLRCKDGAALTVELSVSPLLDNEGNFTGSVAVGRDIRELEGLRRALLQSEKLAATGKLAADIAHEVNNPLGIITNYLQIAKRDLDSSSDPYRMVGIIEEEVQRIALIISGLLDFYRPESAFLAAADVNQLIEDLLILVSIQLEKMGIEVEKDLGEDLLPVVVSPDQFRQVLLNLVTNAQDAMPDGGTLRIRTRRSEDRVVLSLSDSGGGIVAENLPYIFDPFFTTKGKEGTGLGLSVSYGIIQSFDGIMEASSRPGEGTTITISLPARED